MVPCTQHQGCQVSSQFENGRPVFTYLVALGHLEVGRGEEELGREVLLLLVDVDAALLVAAAGKAVKRGSRAPDVWLAQHPLGNAH